MFHLLDIELEQLIEDASDWMMYDSDCEGNISRRLIYLMWSYTEDTMTQVIIPTDVYPEFDFSTTLFGVSFVRDRRLNYEGSEKMISKYKISLPAIPNRKSQLILGIYKGGKSILGCV